MAPLAEKAGVMKAVTDADLTAIGTVFDRPPAPTTDRPDVAAIADLSGLEALPLEPPPELVEAALLRVRESLAPDVDRMTLATLREKIRRQFPDVPVRMLDAALAPPAKTTAAPKTPTAAGPREGMAVQLREDPPWPEPVIGAELLAQTAATVRKYVVVSPTQATTIALWVGVSYAIDQLSIAPILLLTSATMRSGKTTLCMLLNALTPRPILVSSLTPPVIYRLVERYHPTLIADEADTWLSDEKSELRGIICAGHTRATANIPRCVGDDHEVRLFSAWCPRVLAMIGRPPATIRDRSIAIELRRRNKVTEAVDRLRADRIDADLVPLRQRWQRWVNDHAEAIGRAEPDVPATLSDRATDCWRPLLAIAALCGSDWFDRAREAAVEIARIDADDSIGVELLADVRQVFDKHEGEWLESKTLTDRLTGMEDRPWADWRRGRPLTQAGLARALRPFGIVPIGHRFEAAVLRAYRRDQFIDAWSRYLPQDCYTATTRDSAGPERSDAQPPQRPEVAVSGSGIEAGDTGGCGDVAVSAVDAEVADEDGLF